MSRPLKFLLPVLVLAASAWAGVTLLESGPKPERKPSRPSIPAVEVIELHPTNYTVRIRSQGTVSPRTQSTLIPEVAGKIIEVAPSFRSGGFFEPGDVLVRIDPADYENALTIARAELAQARLALREEEAQAEQARSDWERLQMGGEPTDLGLRLPQMESRRAAVAAAEARVTQALTDLERTRLKAPYAGRILDKAVDVGQYVSPGTVLATLYAIDYVEIRLPLTDRQAAFVELPEGFRGEGQPGTGPAVSITLASGGTPRAWDGRLVRSEGAIDVRSRQLYVVAQVDDPYARHADGRPPLKVGQFVHASIEGLTLEDVFVVPREALQGEDQVFVITPEATLRKQRVSVAWRDQDHVVVNGGLTAGEILSTTPLGFAVDGTAVKVHASTGTSANRRKD